MSPTLRHFGALLLLAMLATPVRADVAGRACVIDGDTIMIDGKRRHARCVEGVTVRLFGIAAPDLDQTCKTAGGRFWQCGRAAAGFLLRTLNSQPVTCTGDAEDDSGRVLAVCYVGDDEVNALMVRSGAALAYRDHSDHYLALEDAARADRVGLWQDDFLPPWEWRKLKP